MANSFKSGIHPFDAKTLSAKAAIASMPAPKTLYIPLSQHIGKDAVAVVEKGLRVKAGQLIAKADGAVSSNIFSPVSGEVKGIAERKTANGFCTHIEIENDFLSESINLPPLTNPSSEQIRQRLRDCGIVGMGGAGFPTDIKFETKDKIDTFIINAAECEPYITCDYRILMDYTEQALRGACILATVSGAPEAIIAIEDNKPDAIERVSTFLNNNKQLKARVVTLKTKYPQGAEKQLIYSVTKRKVPVGKLPGAVGVLVSNIHTALSSYLAVTQGQPLYRRVMTVTGGGIKTPSNIWVYNGSQYKDIIEFCGGVTETETVKLLNGGPMMGVSVDSTEISSTKTTSCLLLLTKDEAFTGKSQPCINCARCVKACPMSLMPVYIDLYSQSGDIDNAVKYGASSCIECGCCSFVCPAKRPLVQSIRLAKKRWKAREAK